MQVFMPRSIKKMLTLKKWRVLRTLRLLIIEAFFQMVIDLFVLEYRQVFFLIRVFLPFRFPAIIPAERDKEFNQPYTDNYRRQPLISFVGNLSYRNNLQLNYKTYADFKHYWGSRHKEPGHEPVVHRSSGEIGSVKCRQTNPVKDKSSKAPDGR